MKKEDKMFNRWWLLKIFPLPNTFHLRNYYMGFRYKSYANQTCTDINHEEIL